ncbi:MAG: hypothetical protein MZW92_17250 [Comamonadaceae bacterium]|nr:hypothetical protein [Comamonadaceae bacterium]
MKIQLLSDLHLETEDFEPAPAPQAELLVLAGDIDASWAGYERFAGWPVPVLVVAGNHEFDGRDLDEAVARAARPLCSGLGLTLLERESLVVTDTQRSTRALPRHRPLVRLRRLRRSRSRARRCVPAATSSA